jgi:tetratricopeptide (TPR) repeat protein
LVRRAAIAFHRSSELAARPRYSKISFAEACLILGDLPTATNALESLRTESALSSWLPDEQGEWLRVSALSAVQTNNFKQAEVSLLDARKAAPKNSRIHDALSFIYLVEGRLPEAFASVDYWEKELPNALGAPLRRTAVLMRRGDYTNALPAAERALKIAANNELARLNRAICNLKLGNLTEAQTDYELLLKRRETYEVRYGLAEIAKLQKKKSDELENLDRYLDIAPKTTTEYTNVFTRADELRKGR